MSESDDLMISSPRQDVQEETPRAIMTTGAAQSTGNEEKILTLQGDFSPMETSQIFREEEQTLTSEQFATMSGIVRALSDACSMEFEASEPPISSTEVIQFIDREERTRISGSLANRLATLSEFNEGLENLCAPEGWNRANTRRSPLPLWYPRRPLQDITAVLNVFPAPFEEAMRFKKGSKKVRTTHPNGRLYDSRRVLGQQRAPQIPSKRVSSELFATKRTSSLRKGFR